MIYFFFQIHYLSHYKMIKRTKSIEVIDPQNSASK